jgi:hypothetical protein
MPTEDAQLAKSLRSICRGCSIASVRGSISGAFDET